MVQPQPKPLLQEFPNLLLLAGLSLKCSRPGQKWHISCYQEYKSWSLWPWRDNVKFYLIFSATSTGLEKARVHSTNSELLLYVSQCGVFVMVQAAVSWEWSVKTLLQDHALYNTQKASLPDAVFQDCALCTLPNKLCPFTVTTTLRLNNILALQNNWIRFWWKFSGSESQVDFHSLQYSRELAVFLLKRWFDMFWQSSGQVWQLLKEDWQCSVECPCPLRLLFNTSS